MLPRFVDSLYGSILESARGDQATWRATTRKASYRLDICMMEYRDLGKTGLKTSTIGLGTWVMGGCLRGGMEDLDSIAAIRRALDLGFNLTDTAPIYRHGRAEELVGQAVREVGKRDRIIIARKLGLSWDPAKTKVWRDFSRK